MQFQPVTSFKEHAVSKGVMNYLNGENLTVMWGRRGKGSKTSRHAHPHEQVAWLVSGLAECQIGDGPIQRVEAGTACLIPGGIEHEIWYLEDCQIVEIFAPNRSDLFPDDVPGASPAAAA